MEQTLTYQSIDDTVLDTLSTPRRSYWVVVALLFAGILMGAGCWTYQILVGIGVAGQNNPVHWGTYLINFVFWVGIAHSGTLISAILHLFRAGWRNPIARAAETMTVFAVCTAGLYPFIHLGRVWMVYYMLPVPNQRTLWPNFQSPLMFDVVAISTYLTVSSLFWYTGMLPDLATIRDRAHGVRRKVFTVLSLGWTGEFEIWRHYTRGYLFFAALATPLVISVHSVVSWDFALSVVPGWHTTIFAPYFVAGAIHSGLAMVVTLMIPLRIIFKLRGDHHRPRAGKRGQNHRFHRPDCGIRLRHRNFHRLVQPQPRGDGILPLAGFRRLRPGILDHGVLQHHRSAAAFLQESAHQYPGPFRYLAAGQRGHVVRALRDHHRVGGPRFSAPRLGALLTHPGSNSAS
jgi:hypothetical protein